MQNKSFKYTEYTENMSLSSKGCKFFDFFIGGQIRPPILHC